MTMAVDMTEGSLGTLGVAAAMHAGVLMLAAGRLPVAEQQAVFRTTRKFASVRERIAAIDRAAHRPVPFRTETVTHDCSPSDRIETGKLLK